MNPGPLREALYIRNTDLGEILIFTDGSCLNNGRPNATAGGAFVLAPDDRSNASLAMPVAPKTVYFPLEKCTRAGLPHRPTSNRAELRAVIAALQYNQWDANGYRRLVIATDSEYVMLGSRRVVDSRKNAGHESESVAGAIRSDNLFSCAWSYGSLLAYSQ